MLIKGLLAAEMSGKLGGIVASHNKGGQYFRQLRTPVNPNSAEQQAVRNAFSTATGDWNNVLTVAQREAWDEYAASLGSANALGDFINPGGKGLYTGWNGVRLRAGLDSVDDAPFDIFRPGFTTPTLSSLASGTQQATITFDDSDAWANEDGGAMLIFISPPRNPSVNFFKGPYRLADVVLGDGTTAPTSPVVVDLPFTVGAGQKVFFKFNVTRADGRYSFAQTFPGTVS